MKKLAEKEKKQRGTLEKHSAKDTIKGDALAYVPDAPNFLNDRAKELFNLVANDRLQRELLFEADLAIISAYAQQFSNYEDVAALIKEQGFILIDKNKESRVHPATRLERNYLEGAISCAKLLGISPYFRDKIIGITPGKEDYKDPFDEFMNS